MRRQLLILIGLAVAIAVPAAAQGDLTVDEIVQRTNEVAYYQGDDGRARVTMTITDAQGRKRVKEFTILRLDMDDKNRDQKFYVYFHKPADEQGVVFMVWKQMSRQVRRTLRSACATPARSSGSP